MQKDKDICSGIRCDSVHGSEISLHVLRRVPLGIPRPGSVAAAKVHLSMRERAQSNRGVVARIIWA
jgi:hypothetical protein